MSKLLAALTLTIAACVTSGPSEPDAGAAADAQAERADAGPDAIAAPSPDAATPLGDCAAVCAGQDLSQWDDVYTICRPSYDHCAPAPRCADICDASMPLTCSSATNCQCHKATAVITCVAGTGV